MAKRIAIVTTHPIQYYAPIFRLLAEKLELKVFYTWGEGAKAKFDPGFGKKIEWDIPLLDGYQYEYLKNVSQTPGSHHYGGVDNPDIINRIKSFNPSAILVIGWCYKSHLQIMRYFKGKIPIYFRGDSTLLDNDSSTIATRIKTLFRKILLLWVYSHVDKVFYVGTESKEYFKWAGLKNTQLVFAPHAVDNRRFEENDKEKSIEIKNSLSVPKDAIVVLFAGKLETKKNPELLLNSFLQAKTNDTYLIFLGNGEKEIELKEKAANSQKKNFIQFVDFQNQSMMPNWYGVADVFCLPSRGPGETWGLAVNEAMACGCAIITSNMVGCHKDLVKKDVNGWVFNNKDGAHLNKILENLPSKCELNKMGAASKSIISNWSLGIAANNMIKEWERI